MLPNTWAEEKLGDFVISEKGKKPKNQQPLSDKRYLHPYIDIEAFEKNIIKSYADGENCRFCSDKDFLMVWDGSRSGLVGKGMNGALGSTLVRINFPGINNDYAYYFLKSKFQEINTRAKGSGTPHVDPDLLWNYSFPIAPYNEQTRVVEKTEELFSELDKGIESLKTAKAQLAVYRQALLKNAFEGKLTKQWRRDNADKLESPEQLIACIQKERENRYQQQLDDWQAEVKQWEADGKEGKKPTKPRALKETLKIDTKELKSLPLIPNKWSYQRIGNYIFNIEAGKSFKCDEREPRTDEIGIAKVSAVSWGEYNESESKTCIDSSKINKNYFIATDDFILSRANTIELVGACVIVKKVTKKIMLSDKTLRLNFLGDFQNYFLQYLRSWTGRKEIMNRSTGNQDSMRNIGQDRINSICVPICSVNEMKVIEAMLDNKLSVVDKQINEIDENLLRADVLRQSILKKAFSGQLVAQDPNDDPASELLKKIAIEKAELEAKEKAEKAALRKAKLQAKKAKA